jgi:hypothetical protein
MMVSPHHLRLRCKQVHADEGGERATKSQKIGLPGMPKASDRMMPAKAHELLWDVRTLRN